MVEDFYDQIEKGISLEIDQKQLDVSRATPPTIPVIPLISFLSVDSFYRGGFGWKPLLVPDRSLSEQDLASRN